MSTSGQLLGTPYELTSILCRTYRSLQLYHVTQHTKAVQFYENGLPLGHQLADLTGFSMRSRTRIDQIENLSGLAATELNNPAQHTMSTKAKVSSQ